MAKTGKYTLREDGTWEDRAATPKLLKESLRGLPGELVTKDDENEKLAHELDPPHVVKAVIKDHARKLLKEEKGEDKEKVDDILLRLKKPMIGKVIPLSQREIDVVIFRTISTIRSEWAMSIQAGHNPDMEQKFHLHFPNNNVNEYFLHKGPTPHNCEADSGCHKNKYTKKYRTTVDPLVIPESVRAMFAEMGVEFQDWTELIAQAEDSQEAYARKAAMKADIFRYSKAMH